MTSPTLDDLSTTFMHRVRKRTRKRLRKRLRKRTRGKKWKRWKRRERKKRKGWSQSQCKWTRKRASVWHREREREREREAGLCHQSDKIPTGVVMGAMLYLLGPSSPSIV